MLRPTSGTAIINGNDLRTVFNKSRGSLGLCPQHNILFNELTVREHIIFFDKLKGLNNSQIREDVRRYINLLKLEMNVIIIFLVILTGISVYSLFLD
jgi:ATP-binding cassette subfamily A (ABC1) protein 3